MGLTPSSTYLTKTLAETPFPGDSLRHTWFPQVHETCSACATAQPWHVELDTDLAGNVRCRRVNAAPIAGAAVVGDDGGVLDPGHALRGFQGVLEIADTVHQAEFLRFNARIN